MKTCFVILLSLFLGISVFSQDYNSSIPEDLRKIWNNDNSSTSGIYSTQDDLFTNNDDPGTGTGNGTDNVLDAPVDGGIGILAAAGIALAIRRVRRNKPSTLTSK